MRFRFFLLTAYICSACFLAAQSPDDDKISIGNYFLPFPDYKKSEINSITFARIIVDPLERKSINSFRGIEQMRNLRHLEIDGDNFSRLDFSPLGKLPRLDRLTIRSRDSSLQRLPDLSALQTLRTLEIYNQDIRYLEGIEKISRLQKLEIKRSETAIRDIRVLSSLKELAWLSLSCPGTVVSFADLRGLESMTNLYLDACRVVDFSGIQAFSKLEELDINVCAAENLRELSALDKLTRLSLEFVKGYNLNVLNSLSLIKNLRTLNLSGYYDYDLPRLDARLLENCMSLNNLDLSGFTIENFDTLNNLPSLRRVNTGDSVFFPEDNNMLRDDIKAEYRYFF